MNKEQVLTRLKSAIAMLDESPADVDENLMWFVIGEVEDVITELEANNESA